MFTINVVFNTVPMLERKVSHHQQKLVNYEFFFSSPSHKIY